MKMGGDELQAVQGALLDDSRGALVPVVRVPLDVHPARRGRRW
jgi:hypothetical protein